MRDYDPTTGRYLQADPLGLVDGASVYGYALGNPLRWTDRRGLYTIGDARDSLDSKGESPEGGDAINFYYSDGQLFGEWMELEGKDMSWLKDIPRCPCNIEDAVGPDWEPRGPANILHFPAVWEVRSKPFGGHSSQCSYDAAGNLMTTPPAAGSADYMANTGIGYAHLQHDLIPYMYASSLGKIEDYFKVRPVYAETCCEQ